MIDKCVAELDKARGRVSRGTTKQVSSQDDRILIKALATTWFRTFRQEFLTVIDEIALQPADSAFKALLVASDRLTTREKYKGLFKQARAEVVSLRPILIGAESHEHQTHTADESPDFGPLVADSRMRGILEERWKECVACVQHGITLAGVIMMGGLLEGLLLARIHKEPDKSKVFSAIAAPRDRAGKPKQLNEWGLKDFIDVAHELGWITVPIKDVGGVLRDYRNYVHPQKQYSHGISLSPDDARMFWEIAKSIARSVIKSVK